MSYVDTNQSRNSGTAIAGVVAIHAAIGTVLVTGLSTVVFDTPVDETLVGKNIVVPIETPPPEPVRDTVIESSPVPRPLYAQSAHRSGHGRAGNFDRRHHAERYRPDRYQGRYWR